MDWRTVLAAAAMLAFLAGAAAGTFLAARLAAAVVFGWAV